MSKLADELDRHAASGERPSWDADRAALRRAAKAIRHLEARVEGLLRKVGQMKGKV